MPSWGPSSSPSLPPSSRCRSPSAPPSISRGMRRPGPSRPGSPSLHRGPLRHPLHCPRDVRVPGLRVLYVKVTGGYSLISGSLRPSPSSSPRYRTGSRGCHGNSPGTLEEGSYAVGATRLQTIRGITLPVALPGILTGIILGFGRAAEESAVVFSRRGIPSYCRNRCEGKPAVHLRVKDYTPSRTWSGPCPSPSTMPMSMPT